jgi:hypothetical protein
MTFLINPATLPFKRDTQGDAIERWRRAEELVMERWKQYMAAGYMEREAAYRAYVAALDAEQAAASELEQLAFSKAA